MADQLAWDDFRLVKAIAEARGLTGAAAALGVNHSTVFRRLGQLEDNLGVRLFERHRTGYALTGAGEEMAALAARMDEDVATFARRLAGQTIAPAGELRVTSNDTLLMHLITPLMAEFCALYPDIRLDVVISNQALNLSKRDADVAIRATDSPPETLVGRRVAAISWAIYGRAVDFPQGEKANLRDLFERRWVALGDGFASFNVSRFVRENVPQERIVYRLNTVLGLTEAVEAGIGISPLPCFIADVRNSLVRLSPPQPEFATALWLLTHPELRHAARVRAFLDFMAARLMKARPRLEG